jgi:hypothetical protein
LYFKFDGSEEIGGKKRNKRGKERNNNYKEEKKIEKQTE